MDEYINGKKVEPKVEKETGLGSDNYKSPAVDNSKETREVAHELSMRPFREIFNLSNSDNDVKLQEIITWAKKGTKETDEAIMKIENLSYKLGSPNMGESKLEHLYRRVRILESLGAIADGDF